MKILHLLSNRWNSAITEYAVRSVQALKKTEHQQIVFCLTNTPAVKRFQDLKVEVHELKNFNPNFQTLKQIKNVYADRIFTYGGPEEFLAQIIHHKYIVRFLGDNRQHHPIRHFLAHFKTKHLVAPSYFIANNIKEIDRTPNRVFSVPLGLDAQNLYISAKRKKQPPYILIFGRLDPVKGHEEFLEIFADSFKYGMPEDATLKIIGEEKNTTADEIMEKANQLNISKNIEITTKIIKNKDEVMGSSILGIVPSIGSEVICRVAQEFLICGCPVLTSGVGSLEETLIQSHFGASWRLIPHHERSRFLAENFLKHQKEDNNIRKKRSEIAKENFSLEKFAEKILQTIQ